VSPDPHPSPIDGAAVKVDQVSRDQANRAKKLAKRVVPAVQKKQVADENLKSAFDSVQQRQAVERDLEAGCTESQAFKSIAATKETAIIQAERAAKNLIKAERKAAEAARVVQETARALEREATRKKKAAQTQAKAEADRAAKAAKRARVPEAPAP